MPRPTPARYVPPGSVKVADKRSDAVAYLYTTPRTGRPAAAIYFGKQSRPVLACSFRTLAGREAEVRRCFEARRVSAARVAERRAKERAEGHSLRVGDILCSVWGYEQTNVDFYEVVAVSGCMVTIREVARVSEETGWLRGRCVPQSGRYTGEPMRRRANGDGVRIESYARATKWGTRGPGGIVIGEPERWTAYH